MVDAAIKLQKPYVGAGAVSPFIVMRGRGVLRDNGSRQRQRGPRTEAGERGADAVGIDGVFKPPTQLPQDLPRAGSIAPAGLAQIELSLYGSDFVMC
jgi:hypothetical protein